MKWIATFLCLVFGVSAAANERGSQIYRTQCIECHGARGEGVDGLADEPLYGTKSIEALAGRITRTMPEDDPDLCMGEDADAVAEYIYHAFYSVEARAKLAPARVELARLTVPQYRHSAMDLVYGFRYDHLVARKDQRGLRVSYALYPDEKDYEKLKDKGIVHQEISGPVKHDFVSGHPQVEMDPKKRIFTEKPPKPKPMPKPKGKGKADADGKDKAQPKAEEPKPIVTEVKKFNPDRFKITWVGSIIAEETGTYEFVIRTRNGVQFWVNERDIKSPYTIDGYVVSNNDLRELRAKVFLVGGRTYPVRLDMEKRTNKKDKGKRAEIELLWRPPGGVLATMPQRAFLPDQHHESFVPTVSFPADDRSVGYERGTSVSRAWLDAVNQGAIEAADYVGAHLDELARTKSSDKERAKKLRAFAEEFFARSQRTLKLSEKQQAMVALVFEKSDNVEAAVRQLVILSLTSPKFLYPGLADEDQSDQERVIYRLALALWDSLPTPYLRKRARDGYYKDLKRVDTETWKLMEAPLAKNKLHGFFHHWLELERAADASKSQEAFPEYSEELRAYLRQSLHRQIEHIVWGEGSDYRKLLAADYLFLNEALAQIYPGAQPVKGDHLRPVSLADGQRAGLLTHPYLLSTLAYHDSTSPIHRGVFLSRQILGIALKSPPMANEFVADHFDPTLTMREKVTELTKNQSCMACHSTINPLGFSLEHYDGIGRWREAEPTGKPINSRSQLVLDSGEALELQSAQDVAKLAATQRSAHLAFVEMLFHHTVKQPAAAYDAERLEWLCDSFVAQEFSILDLLKQIAFSTASEGLGID